MKRVPTNLLSKEGAYKLIETLKSEALGILTKNKRFPFTLNFKFALASSENKTDIILKPVNAVILNSIHDQEIQKLYTLQNNIFEGRPATADITKCFPDKAKKSISHSDIFGLLQSPVSYSAKVSVKKQIVDDLNKKFADKLSFEVKAEVDNYGGRDFMDLFFGSEHLPVRVISKSKSKLITEPHLVQASSILFFYSDVDREKLNTLYKKINLLKEYMRIIEENTKVTNALREKLLQVEAIKT